jgi:hypothetical protein
MAQGKSARRQRKWHDSSHASLCVLGSYLRWIGFFRPLEVGIKLKQKVLKYTAVQKLEMVFVSLLAGAKTVAQTGTTLRTDPALQAAFGLPGCADQSVIADTLDAASEADVRDRRAVLATIFVQHSQARRHDFGQGLLVLDLDLSPLPASKTCEGSTKGYMGRCRSKTGRKLVRVRASQYGETVWEDVAEGRTVETLAVLQAAVAATEMLLGLDSEDEAAAAKRGRTEWRLDSGWGSDAMIDWLLVRGYQVTGKLKSTARVRKLVGAVTAWEPTANVGRDVAVVPEPIAFDRPVTQYAVRTPSTDTKKHQDGYQYAVLFTSRTDLDRQATVVHYDDRAAMEADLKSDKRGLGLAGLRKHKLAAQKLVVLLMELAHNVLVWSRRWLAQRAPRLGQFGIVRLVQEVWAVPGRVKLVAGWPRRIRLRPEHPRARDLLQGLRPLLVEGQTLGFWG